MTDVAASATRPPLDPHAAKVMIGEVWSRTLQTFRATPWKYVALVLLPYPFAILGPLVQIAVGKQGAIIPTIVLALLQYFFQFVGQAAAIYGASRFLSGASWTLGESIGVGIKRFLPLIGMAIVVGAPLIVLIVVLIFMEKTGLIIGLLLLVPILMVLAAFILAQQACIIERRGPIESLKRSAFLSKGNRWRLIGIILLFVFIPLIAILVVYLTGGLIVATIHSSVVTIVAAIIAVLTIIPAFIVYQSILTISLAVAFVELRYLKEGAVARDTVAGVFD